MIITKEGTLASFYTVNKAPIKHLRVYFSPKQAGSGTASPENVREISGWDSLRLFFTGKNMLNPNLAVQYPTQKSVILYGVTDWANRGFPDGSITLSSGTYIYSVSEDIKNITEWRITDENDTMIDHAYSTGSHSRTFTITGTKKIRLYISATQNIDPNQVMLYKSTSVLEYEKNKNNNQIITLPSTLYGGYVDLITGELVQEWDSISYVWNEGVDQTIDDETKMKKKFALNYPPISGSANNLSNVLYYGYSGSICIYNVSSNGQGRQAYVTVPSTFDPTTEIQFVYKLYTPIIHQLSPQSLSTFIGRNNIWSNADRIEVEYDLAESNDELYRRRNILLQGAPHLETATGNIANFKTDLIAPIKEAKVYFEPKQLGSGDPSPSNVREIVGYTNLEIKHTGGNLMDPTIAGSTQGQVVQTNVTPNADGTVTIAGRDGTGWVNRAKIDLPAGTYRLYSNFGSGYFSRYEINDIAEEINWQGYKTLTLDEPSYLRFKPAMGTDYPATGWLQLLYGNNDYDPRPYIEEKVNIIFPTLGKNLLDITRTEKIVPGASTSTITIADGVISVDAVATSARTHVMFSQVFPAGTYTIQAQNSGAVSTAKLLCSSEIEGSSYNTFYVAYARQMGSSKAITFTLNTASTIGLVLPNVTNESGNPGTLYDIQLESGSTATAYEPYNNTVYNGYIDLITGAVVTTHQYLTITNGFYSYEANSQYNGTLGTNRIHDIRYNNDNGTSMCDKMKFSKQGIWGKPNDHIWEFCLNAGYQLHVVFDNATVGITNDMNYSARSAAINAWCAQNPLHFVIPLQTPQIIGYVAPQTIKSLKSTNNIWSSANGPVSIKYWTH